MIIGVAGVLHRIADCNYGNTGMKDFSRLANRRWIDAKEYAAGSPSDQVLLGILETRPTYLTTASAGLAQPRKYTSRKTGGRLQMIKPELIESVICVAFVKKLRSKRPMTWAGLTRH